MTRIEVPVLIVGAGPVGLMGALLLARQGLEARIIDRRDSPIRAPAAHVVNARTFEICRAVGVDMDAMAEFTSDPVDAGHVRWMTNLSGEEIGQLPFERQTDEVLSLTPTPLRNLAQHRFEAVLHDTLPKVGAQDVHYGQQWESSEQDEEGVTSSIRDLSTNEVHEVRSRYVIACDGAGSRVRKSLGIEMVGPQSLRNLVMIHFGANLRPLVKDRPAVLYWLMDPKSPGTLVAHDIEREWVYMIPYDADVETEADYPVERCEALVKDAIGCDEYPVEVETISTWSMSAQIADGYRDRRILLAGDAAHRFPPTGGLGLNSGVQDVHDLAWRLAAIEAGWASESLLESYETERRPVAQNNCDNSLRNAMQLIQVIQALGLDRENTTERMQATLDDPEARARVEAAIEGQADHFDTIGLQLGFQYAEGAIVPDGTPPAEGVDPVREFVPSGRPGGRMPHAWLERDGKRISTLDLLALDSFTLVTTSQNDAWAAAVSEVSTVPLRYVALEPARLSDEARWLQESGIGDGGALLIRPDQHVAWRSASLPNDTPSILREVIAQIVDGRPS